MNAYASDGSAAWANGSIQSSKDFADQVDLRIDGENTRIRMPRAMLPRIRGGEDGWFRIKDLRVSDTSITGSVAVSFVNHPKLHVDRRTGSISLSGKSGDYSGSCEKIDVAAPAKF